MNQHLIQAVALLAIVTIEFTTGFGGEPRSAATPGVDPKASALFAAARANRNVWDKDFAGFAAELTVNANGMVAKGNLRVSADGEVELELAGGDDKLRKSVQRTLDSIVGHRLAETGKPATSPAVRFGKDAMPNHPAGTLLEMVGESLHSSYRVKNNQVMVVNRQMGPNQMTITMLENTIADDGRYLPGAYNVSIWDPTGALQSSSTVREQWTKVGRYYLPRAYTNVTTAKNRWELLSIEFGKQRLTAR